jgi:hypothetical protein
MGQVLAYVDAKPAVEKVADVGGFAGNGSGRRAMKLENLVLVARRRVVADLGCRVKGADLLERQTSGKLAPRRLFILRLSCKAPVVVATVALQYRIGLLGGRDSRETQL